MTSDYHEFYTFPSVVVVVGGTSDFRVTPNSNFTLDVNLDLEFDN